MNSKDIYDSIIKLLVKFPNQAFRLQEIARRLSAKTPSDLNLIKNAIRELVKLKRIKQVKRKSFGYLKQTKPTNLVGKFNQLKNGYGVVKLFTPNDGTIQISPQFTDTAMDDDIVSVAIFPYREKKIKKGGEVTAEGEVISIIKRSRKIYTGKFEKSKNFFFVIPDDTRLGRDIYIPRGKTLGARPGNKVSVLIEEWKSRHLNPEGVIVKILGKVGEVNAEILSIIQLFNLPLEFPKEVLLESDKIIDKIPEGEIKRRLDLRELDCFTIDPEDAKDFDDAISLTRINSNLYELGVHIADVSYYVEENSIIDLEALIRGTSVYLANNVIPMLPEKLSNDICSLKPNTDRLTYSVIINITKSGKVKNYKIHKSVINSKRRFTYEEVQNILNCGNGEFYKTLKILLNLSKTLLKNRIKAGGVDFETSEVKFDYDSSGIPQKIIKKVRLDSHRIVEEFMLLANKIVSEHVGNKNKEKIKPFIYRIHDTPEKEKINDLAEFVKQFGYFLKISDGLKSKSLQKLLEDVKGTEEEAVINEVAIRAMSKAIYSENNIGHFGLGFKYYTHFTSPIRRYPDLIVHRLLFKYTNEKRNKKTEKLKKELHLICEQSTLRERIAMEAERESIKVMQVEYMKRHLGDEFRGVISGIVKYGLFIEITDILVEGLIRIRDLDDDFYVYDEKNYTFTGRTTKKRYRLGDKVNVQVVRVDPEEREIDFRIIT